MCTVTVMKNVYDRYPLVVAANRDELLDRASEGPAFYEDSGLMILAPKDLQRGGTWMGVNSAGVFAGVTNRIDVKSVKGRVSRGSLVRAALRKTNAKDAFVELMSTLSASDFNGFNLSIADRDSNFVIQCNRQEIAGKQLKESFWVISNQGVGCDMNDAESRRVRNVLNHWFEADLAVKQPTLENITGLLNVHDAWRYGTCINQPKQNYGTKSSAIILLDEGGWKYYHRERVDETHICKVAFNPVIEFPIGEK